MQIIKEAKWYAMCHAQCHFLSCNNDNDMKIEHNSLAMNESPWIGGKSAKNAHIV